MGNVSQDYWAIAVQLLVFTCNHLKNSLRLLLSMPVEGDRKHQSGYKVKDLLHNY
uniref:hypothetical protein n=1 Tax=Gloeocapsa sp. PCC 7428 TaxID=1173026 RepID=UPI001E60F9D4|nr:hypothetical protein [Gloeocapsa sp. PCC 7428]